MSTRVTYTDGSSIDVERIVPAAYLDVEEALGVSMETDAHKLKVFTRLVHRTLELRHGEAREFREWVEDVDQIENIDTDAETSDVGGVPTGGETTPSPDDSPT